MAIDVGERSRLLIVAGGWPLEAIPEAPPGSVERVPGHVQASAVRAHHVGDLVVTGTAPPDTANPGACVIQGLMLEGRLTVAPGHLGSLALSHATLLPGHGGLAVEAGGNDRLRLSLDHAICAAILADGPLDALAVADSIVGDGDGSPGLGLDAPQAAASLQRCTFFGGVAVRSVEASDCLFAGGLQAERLQAGCVRYSYVPPGSAAPRRYRCQPELEASHTHRRAAPAGARADRRRGGRDPRRGAGADPAAVRLAPTRRPRLRPARAALRVQLRTGAESGAEMGAFEFLKQPQREANLRDALDEYLRFGLEAGLFLVT